MKLRFQHRLLEEGKFQPLECKFQQFDIILPEVGHDLFTNVELLQKPALEYKNTESLRVVTCHRISANCVHALRRSGCARNANLGSVLAAPFRVTIVRRTCFGSVEKLQIGFATGILIGGARKAQTERILSKMDPNHVQGGSRLTDGVGTEYRVVQEQPLIAIHHASRAFRINKQTPAMRFSHGRLDAQCSQTNALQETKKSRQFSIADF